MKSGVWIKPKLILLVRGRPEESVLRACKAATSAGPKTNQCTTSKVWGGSRCNVIAAS